MKELKKELTLDPVIQVNHHLLNTLKIEIAYQNEGYSFATGEFHEKGIICMITVTCDNKVLNSNVNANVFIRLSKFYCLFLRQLYKYG